VQRERSQPVTIWTMWSFASSIFLGAFLLFQVQPLIAKFILPWFGGSPAVWTTCLLFYQTLLVAGYLYAHLLQRFVKVHWQVLVHCFFIFAAMVTLPIEPAAGWKPTDSPFPALRIIELLGAAVGLPYLVLSATSPLMQAWFSHAFPGRSPYGFYALSNFGSMLALLSYPFLFEPIFGLRVQSELWSGAFVCFAGLNVLCALALRSKEQTSVSETGNPKEHEAGHPTQSPGWFHRIQWLILTASASVMLLATTNMVCQDIAVVPFLWVLPLSLYLLSFILCFGRAQWCNREFWGLVTVLILCLLSSKEDLEGFGYSIHFSGELILYFAGLFSACMVCHGECVRLRPEPEHLTEFYLVLGVGGALGGLFAGLVAPNFFHTYLEWKLGAIVCYALALMVLIRSLRAGYGRLKFVCLLIALPVALIGVLSVVSSDSEPTGLVERTRNFYGVVAVYEKNVGDPTAREFVMKHGTTLHGRQFVDVAKKRWPTAYYAEESGVGRAIGYYQEHGAIRVGAVGLGVGTIATYARPEDDYRFYEINPEVLRLARQHFTYLADCRGKCEVILGDGRVSLEREPPQNFDVLVLDAFSSDAVPVHLLTREAFALYRQHVAPRGVIAVHISNRHLHLAPVVRGMAEHFGFKSLRIITQEVEDRLTLDSDWILLTENDDLLGSVPVMPSREFNDEVAVPLWTDHFSSLFPLLHY